jgi:hypothetical protein
VQFETAHMRLLREECKRSGVPAKRCGAWRVVTDLVEGRASFQALGPSGTPLSCASAAEAAQVMQRGASASLKRARQGGSKRARAQDTFWEDGSSDVVVAAEPDEASLALVKNLQMESKCQYSTGRAPLGYARGFPRCDSLFALPQLLGSWQAARCCPRTMGGTGCGAPNAPAANLRAETSSRWLTRSRPTIRTRWFSS